MSKFEAIRCAYLSPRGDSDAEPPSLRFCHAASFEEPDLRVSGAQGYAHELTELSPAPTLLDFARAGLLSEPDHTGFLMAVVRRGSAQSIAFFGNFPLRQVQELQSELPPVYESPPQAYIELLQRNRATLDPLVLAQAGVKPGTFDDAPNWGTRLAVQEGVEGTQVELRWITSEFEQRAVSKAFEPGVLNARPDPLILDGPIGLARWAVTQGHEHIFACVVPVGEGFASLRLNELLISAGNPDASDAASLAPPADPLTNGRKLSPFFHGESPLPLPDGLRHLRYYYSDTPSKEYAREDWSEDVRIESRVADSSAISLRDYDELGLIVGERSHDPIAVAQLYQSHIVLPGGIREVLRGDERASRAFNQARGDVALWTPLVQEVDWTKRIMRRRPSLEVRRALVSLALPIPMGTVVTPVE